MGGILMAKVDARCPFCEQTAAVKKHGLGSAGHQRYRSCFWLSK
ncbi:IS1 family transposase [Klebsiella grimontii]|nr:IS1 family transposase [Klebsiella grimontii]